MNLDNPVFSANLEDKGFALHNQIYPGSQIHVSSGNGDQSQQYIPYGFPYSSGSTNSAPPSHWGSIDNSNQCPPPSATNHPESFFGTYNENSTLFGAHLHNNTPPFYQSGGVFNFLGHNSTASHNSDWNNAAWLSGGQIDYNRFPVPPPQAAYATSPPALNGLNLDNSSVKPLTQSFGGLNINSGFSNEKFPVKNEISDYSQSSNSTVGSIVTNSNIGMDICYGKSKSWATIASQPAKTPLSITPISNNPRVTKSLNSNNQIRNNSSLDIGTWNNPPLPAQSDLNGHSVLGGHTSNTKTVNSSQSTRGNWSIRKNVNSDSQNGIDKLHPVLEKLKTSNDYNSSNFDIFPKDARFFIIKSYSEDDIHRSIKYEIWCSTEHGNKKLDAAFKSMQGKGPVYLFYSVNASGHFCGLAQMMSEVDYSVQAGVWEQSKWKGRFEVKWLFVKDVPNNLFRHIRLENNENKPVTNSRDTQEVPLDKGRMMLKVMTEYRHATSIFDDFSHYEKRQEEQGNDSSKQTAHNNHTFSTK